MMVGATAAAVVVLTAGVAASQLVVEQSELYGGVTQQPWLIFGVMF